MKAPSRPQKTPAIRTVSAVYDACRFRSLVSLTPGTRDELLSRVGAAFAAVGGEITPIAHDTLAELVETVRAGQTVVVLGDRQDLRDAAKAQLMAAINATVLGAEGSA